MNPHSLHWRDIIGLIEICLQPDRFDREIQALLGQGYQEDEASHVLSGLVGHYVVEAAGLAAALGPSPDAAIKNLRELAASLGSLEPGDGIKYPSWQRQSLYERFISDIYPLFADVGLAMSAVLMAYVTSDYDLEEDPNALMAKADRMAQHDLDRAKAFITRAGAMALRGQRFWWGWPLEIAQPARYWAGLVAGFVDSITREGSTIFRAVAAERKRWAAEIVFLKHLHDALVMGRMTLAEIQLSQKSEPVDSELEESIYALFDGEETLSAELIAVFAKHREAVLTHLIDLAQDQRLWSVGARGDGWAPIHAVDVLAALGAVDAVEPLLQMLTVTDPNDCLHDHILLALQQIGQPALPAILDVMNYSRNRRLKLELAPILGSIGQGSETACDALTSLYHDLDGTEDPGLAVLGLVALRDSRTLSLLQDILQNPRLTRIDRIEVQEALASM